jgi:DNA-nicking Smr family endonuclease
MSRDHKGSGRHLTDDDRTVWSLITRTIAPLKRRRAQPVLAEAPASEPPAVRKAPSAPVIRRPVAPAVPPLVPLDRRSKQRIARGREPIEARLDLHGLNQSKAHAVLSRFVQRAQANGACNVLVITGKGASADPYGSRGVLKRQVPLWLRLPEFRAYVVSVEDAHSGHGGEGALYVRIRRARDRG